MFFIKQVLLQIIRYWLGPYRAIILACLFPRGARWGEYVGQLFDCWDTGKGKGKGKGKAEATSNFKRSLAAQGSNSNNPLRTKSMFH